MNSPSANVEFDMSALVRKLKSRAKTAQLFLDESVMKDTDRYVRFRTGALARSVQTATRAGTGEVVYDTPYARKVYYDTASIPSTAVHPSATAFWFEAAKKQCLPVWLDGVKKILREGNG